MLPLRVPISPRTTGGLIIGKGGETIKAIGAKTGEAFREGEGVHLTLTRNV